MTQTATIQIRRRGDRITVVRVYASSAEEATSALHMASCDNPSDAILRRFSFYNSGFRQDGPGWWIARTHGS